MNSGNIPVYGTGGYMLSVNDKLSDADAVGIGRKGTIDKPLYLRAPFWTVDTLFYCTSKENSDVKFIYLLFQIINWKRYDESTGVPSLSKNTISSIKTYVPKVKEQDHISKLFFSLDNTLQLHERKCEELALIKKALLQKLFPKKDEIKPEVRYKNFSDAWEQRKLGEVTTRVRGNDGRMNLPTLTISAASGWLDQRERFSGNIAGKEQKNYTLLSEGELSYNHGNSKLAKYGTVFVLRNYKEALVPRVYHSFKADSQTSADFIEYIFSTKRTDRELSKLITSGARMDGLLNINFDNFMSIKINLPLYDEQLKIVKFLREFDSLIALHQRKLEKLKQLKKFLLQNMFI